MPQSPFYFIVKNDLSNEQSVLQYIFLIYLSLLLTILLFVFVADSFVLILDR